MKRILLVEDNGDTSYDIKSQLESFGYEIKQADSYLSALGMWRKYSGEFGCIILDLNISPEGLDDEDVSSYFPISSLPFLLEIGWGNTPTNAIKVVVYSGYVNDFKEICETKGISYSGIVIIEKKGTSLSELINYVVKNVE